MSKAAERYLRAMVKPCSGGLCRYCNHHVRSQHVGDWCAECAQNKERCGAAVLLEFRAAERAMARVTR